MCSLMSCLELFSSERTDNQPPITLRPSRGSKVCPGLRWLLALMRQGAITFSIMEASHSKWILLHFDITVLRNGRYLQNLGKVQNIFRKAQVCLTLG